MPFFERKSIHDNSLPLSTKQHVVAGSSIDEEWTEEMFEKDVVQFLASMRIKDQKRRRRGRFVGSPENDTRDDYDYDYDDDKSRSSIDYYPMDQQPQRNGDSSGSEDDKSSVELDRLISSIDDSSANNWKDSSRHHSAEFSLEPCEEQRIQIRVHGSPVSSTPPSSTTTLILDELQDMETKIIGTFIQDRATPESVTATEDECMLWKLLWQRQWDRAKERLQSQPEEAARMIDFSRILEDDDDDDDDDDENDGTCNDDDDDSVLPLHLSCLLRPLPPTWLIRDLVDANPAACRYPQSSSGLLPIHMAADLRPAVFGEDSIPTHGTGIAPQKCIVESINHGNIIDLLVLEYPESLLIRETIRDMTPLHIATSTVRAENGIVSPVVAEVLDLLLLAGQVATMCQDATGRTPQDWAWENVDYFCPYCGITQRCNCNKTLSVTEKCIHPLLRTKVYECRLPSTTTTTTTTTNPTDGMLSLSPLSRHMLGLQSMSTIHSDSDMDNNAYKANTIYSFDDDDDLRYSEDDDIFATSSSNVATESPRDLFCIQDLPSSSGSSRDEDLPLETSITRTIPTGELNNSSMSSASPPKHAQTTNAVLHTKVHLSQLVHLSKHGRHRKPPVPCFY